MSREKILSIIRWLVNRLVNLRVVNGNNIPPTGGYLVVTSHISRLDTPFLMLSTFRKDIIGMLAREYERKPFFRWVLNAIKVIWVSRTEFDFAAFREAVNYMKQGWIVGMAPEGTRSKDGKLLEGKQGAALLAGKAAVQVIPAAVFGSNLMVEQWSKLRKMQVEVIFGEPFSLPEQGDDQKAWLAQATDEIMCRIAVLLPPERRGYYANHPRVAELLASMNPQTGAVPA